MVTLLTSQTPAGVGTDGGPGITTGTTEIFTEAGSITGVRFWSDGGSGTYTVAGWRVTASDFGAGGAGTPIFDPIIFVGTPAVGWNEVPLEDPVPITPSTAMYRAGVHHPTDYALTNGFFTSGGPGASGLTNGPITAPADDTDPVGLGQLRQGTFTIDAALSYPRQVGASALYFVEFLFEPEGEEPQEVAPSGIAVPVALGTPALSQALSVAPSGISVPVALGSLAVSQGGIVPSGIAVPATLGTPTLSQALSVTPAGISVPAALGTPALSQALSVTPSGLAVPATLGSIGLSQTIEPGFAIAPEGVAVPVTLGSISVANPVARGSWESLRGIVREARADHARNQERLVNPLDCPEHGWPLEITSRGRHCLFGGHVV